MHIQIVRVKSVINFDRVKKKISDQKLVVLPWMFFCVRFRKCGIKIEINFMTNGKFTFSQHLLELFGGRVIG